jgi:hypothetical protein
LPNASVSSFLRFSNLTSKADLTSSTLELSIFESGATNKSVTLLSL